MAEYLADSVARGAALLDERRPGWEKLIDLEILDLGAPSQCVVGQLYPGYSSGVVSLFGFADWRELRALTIEHGFSCQTPNLGYRTVHTQYKILTELWRDEIRKRSGPVLVRRPWWAMWR